MHSPRAADSALRSEIQLDGYSLAPLPHGTNCQDTRRRIVLKLQGLLASGQIQPEDLDEHSRAAVLEMTEDMRKAA